MSTRTNRQPLTRTYDYLYDPVYTVCSAKDHFKAAVIAAKRTCLYRTCENFPPVSYDQLKYPDHLLKIRSEPFCALGQMNYEARIRQVYMKVSSLQLKANLDPPKRIDINGQHRHLFYRRPVMPFLKPAVPTMRFHMNLEYDNMEKAMKDAAVRCCHLPDRTQTKQTQTDYRESEAQTSPWTPPYKVRPDENPEVLTIAHLSWGHGLPAGMHEVEIINRMRMKRAWEAILPPMDNATNIKTRTTIIEAMEIDDWAFREAEIQFMMDTRMELMEKYAKLKDAAREKSIGDRYQRVEDLIDKRRDMEIRNIRQKLGRELRKLTVKYHGGQNKWAKKCSAARGLGDSIFKLKKSAKNYHEIINRRILDDKNVPDADENDKYVLLPTYSELKAVKPKQKAHELCVRETRWNEEKLRKLHAELKSIRMDIKPDKNTSFMKRRYKLPPMPITPKLSNERNVNESQERAAVLIQTLVTGRAIQCVMFEGRDRCRELIEELQSTHWLQSDTKKLRQMEKRHVIELQQSENHRTLQEDRLNEILNMLEGMTLSGMLDYLSKELVRLKDERKAHAFALLAERERTKREAEEAGRRQLEEQRRRECDEMFRQMVKVNQDTVELYLEDIIKEGIEWVSDAEAKQYILETADKVDKTLQYANEHAQGLAEQEMVSDMIYNFVLPDVDKQIVRKRMLERQASYLKNAHAAIYNKILELPPIERKTPSTEPTAAGESDKTAEVEEERLTEPDQLVEELTEETSADWIKRRIIGEIISPEETLTGSILKHLISRSVLSDGEKIARYILENVIKDVEALVGNSQMSILISARSSASGSSGSSYSSVSSAKSNAPPSHVKDTETLD